MSKVLRTAAACIGRYQMFHWAHNHQVQRGLELADEVVIELGSSWRSRNPRNPFTFSERREMIRATLSPQQRDRVRFRGVRDVYDNARWAKTVREQVQACTAPGTQITLVGFEKDATSAYLRDFPEWSFHNAGSPIDLDATRLRDIYFTDGDIARSLDRLSPFVPDGALQWLGDWARTQPALYEARLREHLAVQQYRKTYPGPIYYTSDAVIEAAGHVLLIERGQAMGLGTLAFPGGHRDPGEDALLCALRELTEETGLAVSREQLMAALVDRHVFDAPGRSPRGRIVTEAFHFNLEGFTPDTLPAVQGMSDARKASWVLKSELPMVLHNMFDDHDVIAERFLGPMQPLAALTGND